MGEAELRTVVMGREVVPQLPMVADALVASSRFFRAGHHFDWYFNRNRIHVITGHIVGIYVCEVVKVRSSAQHYSRSTKVERVEDGAEVDVEGVVDGSGKHLDAVVQRINGLIEKRRIVRDRSGSVV